MLSTALKQRQSDTLMGKPTLRVPARETEDTSMGTKNPADN